MDVEHALPARWLRCETGATWLDLVATVSQAYGPTPIEHLSSASRLREWLATQNLRPKTDPVEADLIRARELREALRGLALAAVHSEPLPRDNAALLGKVLAEDRPLTLSISPRLEIRPPATARAALARVARQAAEDLAGPAAATLHTCADPVCGMLFLDPGGRRRWCSADVCGVRNRVRAHRQRRGADS